MRLHRALLRCVLQETAPRPGCGFPALPVLQHEILLFFLGLDFLPFRLLLTSDLGLHLHSLYLWVDLWPSEVENLLSLPLLPRLQENLETCCQSYIRLDFVPSVTPSFCVKEEVSAVVDRMLWSFWASPWQVTRWWSKPEFEARWPSRHAPEELDSSELGPIQWKGCPGAIFQR